MATAPVVGERGRARPVRIENYSFDGGLRSVRCVVRSASAPSSKSCSGVPGFRYNGPGAHVLRHSVATQMVVGGGTFKEIADVLGRRVASHVSLK